MWPSGAESVKEIELLAPFKERVGGGNQRDVLI
jgi:hypothetical protein